MSRGGPVLFAGDALRDRCDQLLRPAGVLPGVVGASGDFRQGTELSWVQKGRGTPEHQPGLQEC